MSAKRATISDEGTYGSAMSLSVSFIIRFGRAMVIGMYAS